MSKTVCVIDDDPTQRRLLQAAVERAGFGCRVAPDGETGFDIATNSGVDVVLLDLVMPGWSGMETLEKLMEKRPDLPVIMLTATSGIETIVKAMRGGAVDFLVKPANPERVLISIQNAMRIQSLTGEVKRLKRQETGGMTFADMIADAPAMRSVVKMGERAAVRNIPMLILGESGVGKEVFARCVQGASERAGKPFITVNCGAIPENLVESILFGHEKGAFTGAVSKSLGKFVEADGGTLFLDEVGELPLETQVKLLRVLQEGEVDPVGGRRPVKVDVRIISATNRDVKQQIADGSFREDLYYRLNVFPVDLPPLRERKEDITALVQRFITRFNATEGLKITGISDPALALLSAFDWPGNIRQLENTIFRAVILCDSDTLQPVDFPTLAEQFPNLVKDLPVRSDNENISIASDNKAVADQCLPPLTNGALDADALPVSIYDSSGDIRAMTDIEGDILRLALDHYEGHISQISRKLGIGRSTLYRKIREHDLDHGDTERASA